MVTYFLHYLFCSTSESFFLEGCRREGLSTARKIFIDIEYRHKFRFMPVFDIETQDKKPCKGDREGSRGTKAYYTLGKPRRTPGIPDFQIPPRSQVSRGARSAADHFDLRPHQSSPNHTPLISAWHESRRTFSRNGQKRTYSSPPPSSSSRSSPPLVTFVHPRFPSIVKTRVYDASLERN